MLNKHLKRMFLAGNVRLPIGNFNYYPRFWESTSKFSSFRQIPLTQKDVQVNYVRSSGPGGQSVNKTNSKAQVRLKIAHHSWIDSHMEINLKNKYGKFINKEDQIVLSSQVHKSQSHNLQTCLDKLKKMLYECSLVKQQRKFDIPAQTQEMAIYRIFQKRKKGQVKSMRQKNNKFLYD